MRLLLIFLLFPMLTALGKAKPTFIDRPSAAHDMVTKQVLGLSEKSYLNLMRYAYDSGQGSINAQRLQRVIQVAQWQAYRRIARIAAQQEMVAADERGSEADASIDTDSE